MEEIKQLSYKKENIAVIKIGHSYNDKKKFGKKKQHRQQTHQRKNQPEQNNKPKIRKNQCSYCKKLGHWKKDCFILKRKNNNNEVTQNGQEEIYTLLTGNVGTLTRTEQKESTLYMG